MNNYKSPVMQAVANPPTMLLVPFELAIMNVVATIVLSLVLFMLFAVPMFFGIVIAMANHVALLYVSQRDQHIVTVIRAMGKYPPRSRNIVPFRKGAKYVP